MDQPQFLLDESLPHRAIRKILWRREPRIHVQAIGRPATPGVDTADLALLEWIAEHNFLLVTRHRATLLRRLVERRENGRHIPGVLIVSRGMTTWQVVDVLHVLWHNSLPNEYRNQLIYLPHQNHVLVPAA